MFKFGINFVFYYNNKSSLAKRARNWLGPFWFQSSSQNLIIHPQRMVYTVFKIYLGEKGK